MLPGSFLIAMTIGPMSWAVQLALGFLLDLKCYDLVFKEKFEFWWRWKMSSHAFSFCFIPMWCYITIAMPLKEDCFWNALLFQVWLETHLCSKFCLNLCVVQYSQMFMQCILLHGFLQDLVTLLSSWWLTNFPIAIYSYFTTYSTFYTHTDNFWSMISHDQNFNFNCL